MRTFHQETSLLELGGLVDNGRSASNPRVCWSRMITHGHQQPGPRYAGLGFVWESSLLVFAGRTSSRFFDELWFLDLKTLDWSKPVLMGQGPSPRVWCRGARCGDSLLVYGGAEWRFDHLCWGNDAAGKVWSLQVTELCWEGLDLSPGPKSTMRVCPTVVMCGTDL